ncbi:FAD linked oxidase [Lasiodiplodia theobromae]|uniref:Putative FAD-linked oxidoreductase n=1 Tax=Lasiodiplodia theobromae TaxID=45133 RepID=A0A5N5DMC5_9PEZI|nr:FAD linked oxidase [Lasiodiplodia theobromae]KAB2579065.1 putative FAD-linked oxidoreductase [Lasiodiplodia theobromae]KAF4544700.1 FAD linked oxidase [Lasiodiplodia theobromae]KAF9637927.1 FAD linked oxidase [Lasiodiplodia theobromae]
MAALKNSLLFLLAANAGAAVAQNFSSPAAACQFFSQNYPNITSFPNQTTYNDINEAYWSAAAALGPACIFSPTSSDLMSAAVKALVKFNAPFAIKGGGHMAIAGAANIDSSGVLLSSSNLNQLELSEDKSSVAVGPGNRWGDVFEYLEPHGLAVVGGRMSIVGVPGLLMGGGISNFGNEFGWASSNIDAYTCVLSDGDVVVANATNEYADLFWALRGGGNSFCLITSFQMRTIEVPVMTAGQRAYGSGDTVGRAFLDSVYEMTINPTPDVKGALTPIARAGDSINGTTYNAMFYYNGNNTTPDFFANFSEPVLTPEQDTYAVMSGMGAASKAMSEGTDQVEGLREGWWVVSIVANREAMQIIHDTYFAVAAEYFADVEGWITGLAYNIISKEFVVAGITNGGDPMGLDPNAAPYFWVEESMTWTHAEDDATVQAFYEAVNKNITAQLEPLGVLHNYLYLNDVNQAQDVFAGYPKSSVQLLKMIRDKYDPDMVFTKQMPGGFKVANAQ